MTTQFSMLDKTSNYIKDAIGSNPKKVIQHVVATRECIMRNGPSNHCSQLSPINMSVDIMLEGFLNVFILDQEYKTKDPVFIHDVARQLIIGLIQHYNENDDICDKYVDRLMVAYNHYKVRETITD